MESRFRPRVLIADYRMLVAQACKNLLESEFDVVAVVRDGSALLKAAEKLRPDVVILDISMPNLNGLDAGQRIKQKKFSTRLIYLTMSLGSDVAAEAFRRGALGYMPKQSNCRTGSCGTACAPWRVVSVTSRYKGDLGVSPSVGCHVPRREAYFQPPAPGPAIAD